MEIDGGKLEYIVFIYNKIFYQISISKCSDFSTGAAPVPPLIFEMIIEHLEETCWENIHKLLKTEESLSIEFDEDVICDVCRSVSHNAGEE